MITLGASARQLFKLALWRSSALALGVLIAGCASAVRFQPQPSPAVPSPVALAPAAAPETARPSAERLILGERMTYTITWLGLSVMRGELRVADTPVTQEGRSGIEITGTAHGAGIALPIFGIHDRAAVWVDPQTLLPIRSELALRHRFRRTMETVTYEYGRGRAVLTGAKTVEIPVTPETRDLLSACYALRTLHLEEGRRFELSMIADNRSWTVIAIPRRRGILTMSQGAFPVLEVELQSSWLKQYAGRESLWIWVTTDATRTPLMARITIPFVGTLTALMDDRQPAWPPGAPSAIGDK